MSDERTAEAKDEVALLKADNAALLSLLRKHARRVSCPACGGVGSRTCSTCDHGEIDHFEPDVTAALNASHHGAAMLERMKRLETTMERLAVMRHVGHATTRDVCPYESCVLIREALK